MTLSLSRRGLLGFGAALVAGPAIVRVSGLMALPVPRKRTGVVYISLSDGGYIRLNDGPWRRIGDGAEPGSDPTVTISLTSWQGDLPPFTIKQECWSGHDTPHP